MKVYIRHESEADSKRVAAEISHPNQLEGVLDALQYGGGVYHQGKTYSDMSYQFATSDAEIFGEIILHDDEPNP